MMTDAAAGVKAERRRRGQMNGVRARNHAAPFL
jgi:hypothetical protein